MRGLILINVQAGAGAVYWPSPAARAMRLAADACGVARGCVPIVVQEGDVAVYWPSPAACAQRLTAAADAVAVRSIEAKRRGYGRVLTITRGWRHAAHGDSPATRRRLAA